MERLGVVSTFFDDLLVTGAETLIYCMYPFTVSNENVLEN